MDQPKCCGQEAVKSALEKGALKESGKEKFGVVEGGNLCRLMESCWWPFSSGYWWNVTKLKVDVSGAGNK